MWGMNRLGSSLIAGAVAAAGLFLIQLGYGASVAGRGWVAVYLILLCVGFSAAGATHRQDFLRRTGVATLGVAGVLFGWLGLFPGWERFSASGMSLLALGLMFVFGFARSGLIDVAGNLNPRRALIVEAVLGVTALLFAAWLAGPAPYGSALALWGYVLVQSLYACIPRSFLVNPVVSSAKETDPFETALARLNAMLGDPATQKEG